MSPLAFAKELVDVLVLVIGLHHPNALFAQSPHDREDGEQGVSDAALQLLLDANHSMDKRDGRASTADTRTAMHKEALSLISRLLRVNGDELSCLLNEQG